MIIATNIVDPYGALLLIKGIVKRFISGENFKGD
jgi:hypothetical protein